MRKIGFIGLGNMGSGMAANLLGFCVEQKIELCVFDLNSQAVQALADQGARPASSVKEAAEGAQVVFTSLPGADQIEQIAEQLFDSVASEAVWFECSTNDAARWSQVKSKAPAHIHLVDAPVTGGAEGAAAGTLTMLLGIDEALLSEHRGLLESMAAKVVRMGESGAGYATKLCQLHLNYLVALGIGETMMLGAKSNIDLGTLYKVLQKSCAQSYVVDSYIPKVLDGSYDPSFSLGLAYKDMRLIRNLADHLEVSAPLASEVCDQYADAVDSYGEQAPHLKVVKLIEDQQDRLLR